MSLKPAPLLAVVLLVATAAVFGRVAGHPFIHLDDPQYIFDNPQVRQGLTPQSTRWAFTTFHAMNWHPLTWLSHELDVTLFGLAPGGHHLVSVALHGAAATALLFFLARTTGSPWPSFLVAICFAVHPLRVESVAWAAERKDVLAALFAMLTLTAYLGAVRRPGPARRTLVFILFALGLMAKPMLVTLPLVLLFLDFWPLGRLRGAGNLRPLLVEKAPLFALSLASSLVTLAAQAGAVVSTQIIPLPQRLANAAVSVATYVGVLLVPSGLSIYYPWRSGGPGAAATLAAVLLLLCAATITVRAARRRPYLVTGLCWYLAMLLPVAGLVQVGIQSRADRYTYLPSAGLLIAGAWLARDFARRSRNGRRRALLAAGCAALVLVWGLVAVRYLTLWKDGETLFRHAISANGDNWMARYGLGIELVRKGRRAEAQTEFERLTALVPDFAEGHYNLGLSLEQGGDTARAESEYRAALRFDPGHHGADTNLGIILVDSSLPRSGRFAEGIEHFRRAAAILPGWAEGRLNLADALQKAGENTEAEREYRAVIELEPGNAEAHNNLGILLAERGDRAGAIEQIRAALRTQPDNRDGRPNPQ